ncbi:MAG: hypothetical protein J6X67_06695 [Treponema sp.]|nr:hypothetical protein [Treponema sp.]
MESRICFFAAVLISLLFCGTATLFAEDASKRNATSASKQNHAQTTAEVGGGGENAAAEAAEAADDEEENPAFVGNPLTPEESWQILSWEEKNPGAVLKYEVVVESASAHEELRRMETKRSETSIHVFPLLPPGRYRYKVVTYDLVGSPAAESDWTNITIYAAHQPEISSIKSTLKHSSTIYLDEINDGKFSVKGRNLFPPREGKDDVEFTEYALVPKKKAIGRTYKPNILSQGKDNRSMEIQFDMDTLDSGVYHFRATDASGLFTPDNGDNELIVRYTKPMDLNVSIGYSCPFILYDDTFKKYMGSNIWPLSANAKPVFIPFKHSWGYLGVGLLSTYTRMNFEEEYFTIDGNLITASGLLVYQKPIKVSEKSDPTKKRHLGTIEIHAGGGAAYFYNYQYHFDVGTNPDPLYSFDGCALVGASFQYYLTPRIFVEAQADFITSFISDMTYGMIVPSINIGYQF